MARPKAKELTQRELEIMHVFWADGQLSAVDVRERLADKGTELAYTTVATLVKILVEKSFLEQVTTVRPFEFKPIRSFEDVSKNLLSDVIQRVFGGSREQLLVQLMDQKKLTKRERELLKSILEENGK
jgi:predicted transcriptional regulator